MSGFIARQPHIIGYMGGIIEVKGGSALSVSLKRKIETTEPVQSTIDFLEEVLAMDGDEEVTDHFWDELLKGKRREIMEDYYVLAPLLSTMEQGLCYSGGMDSGRMLVMRILLGLLPPSYPRGFSLAGINENLRGAFRDVITYLKSLHMANEGDHVLWEKSVAEATGILLQRGFSPYFFRRGGLPVLVAAPPYRETTAACYLAAPHAVVLYSNGGLSPERRLYYCLHEMGHLIFEKNFARRPASPFFRKLVAWLEHSQLEELLCPGTQGDNEIFANLFAFTMLMGTSQGDLLFGHYGEGKSWQMTHLLQRFFSPSALFRHK